MHLLELLLNTSQILIVLLLTNCWLEHPPILDACHSFEPSTLHQAIVPKWRSLHQQLRRFLKKGGMGWKENQFYDRHIYIHTHACVYIYICILGNTPRISPMKMAFLVKPIENCVNDLVTVTWNRLCLNVSFIFGPSPPLKLTDFACQLAGVHSKFPRRPQHISYPSDITMAKIFAF